MPADHTREGGDPCQSGIKISTRLKERIRALHLRRPGPGPSGCNGYVCELAAAAGGPQHLRSLDRSVGGKHRLFECGGPIAFGSVWSKLVKALCVTAACRLFCSSLGRFSLERVHLTARFSWSTCGENEVLLAHVVTCTITTVYHCALWSLAISRMHTVKFFGLRYSFLCELQRQCLRRFYDSSGGEDAIQCCDVTYHHVAGSLGLRRKLSRWWTRPTRHGSFLLSCGLGPGHCCRSGVIGTVCDGARTPQTNWRGASRRPSERPTLQRECSGFRALRTFSVAPAPEWGGPSGVLGLELLDPRRDQDRERPFSCVCTLFCHDIMMERVADFVMRCVSNLWWAHQRPFGIAVRSWKEHHSRT